MTSSRTHIRLQNIARPFVILTTLVLAGCSGDGQQGQQGDPVNQAADGAPVANSSLNGGGKKVSEGEGMNNATQQGGNNFSGANAGANGGAAVNNAMLNNPAAGGNPLANPAMAATEVPLNATTPLNNGTMGLSNNATPPTNNAAAAATNGNSNIANAAPTSAAPPAPQAEAAKPPVSWDRMNASPLTNPQMNWPGRGKVKYVTRRATKHAAPNGPVVGEMETGDHPLIYQNGNWVELQNGTFIKGNSMSDKGVGYERRSH